jgi:uncharacterized protein YodC (DUF2158 family)
VAFEPGDVVMLKSGGHSMTVVSVDEDDIDCLWVGDDGELFRQSIPGVALTVVEMIDPDETDQPEDEAEQDEGEEDDEDEGEDDDEDDDDEDDDDDDEGEERRAKGR